MNRLHLFAPDRPLDGTISLEGSKSISNRLLIIRALSGENTTLYNIAQAADTETLQRLLQSTELEDNVGAAGTTMRFLTAYHAMQNREKKLSGSLRMLQRPIHILVDALRTLGADIQYTGAEGYPPLHIRGKKLKGGTISVRADISSQYISALMMIAPYVENGLHIVLEGKISSGPYIEMTLALMRAMGAQAVLEGEHIRIEPTPYIAKDMQVESDWSAASYYFSCCALSPGSTIRLRGLFHYSLQGDSVLPDLYASLGVESHYVDDTWTLRHTGDRVAVFEKDFSDCPDLAQTVIVSCAALGIEAKCTGLESLRIKETDRTAALQNELAKYNVDFFADGDAWHVKGKAEKVNDVHIQTYDDHRMAMAFAPLSISMGSIVLLDPDVVRKSYPSFWKDLALLGFRMDHSA